MAKGNDNKDSGEHDHWFNSLNEKIEKNSGFFHYLTKDFFEAENLKQAVKLKFFRKAKAEPEWLATIEDFDKYLLTAAKHIFFNIKTRPSIKYVNIGERDVASYRKSSDGGNFDRRFERALAYKDGRNQINSMLEQNFSPYEQAIWKLKYRQNCKPIQVANILLEEHIELLKDEFPEYINLSQEEFAEKMREFIPKDCNRLRAKFRNIMNDHFGTTDSDWL